MSVFWWPFMESHGAWWVNDSSKGRAVGVGGIKQTRRRSQRQHHPHERHWQLGFWFNKDGTCPMFIWQHTNTRSMRRCCLQPPHTGFIFSRQPRQLTAQSHWRVLPLLPLQWRRRCVILPHRGLFKMPFLSYLTSVQPMNSVMQIGIFQMSHEHYFT